MSRKKILLLVVIIFVLILGIGFFVYHSSTATHDVSKEESTTVKKMNLNAVISATGTIRPLNAVEVSSKITARVKQILVKENDIVHKGETIAILDGKDYEAKRDEALARLSNMEAKYKRISHLYDIGASTKAEYEDALYNYETAKTHLSMAEADLRETVITSPINGIVLGEPVEAGSMAVQGIGNSTVIMHIADLSKKQIKAKIDETDIGKIAIGQEAVFTVDAYPNKKFHAHVRSISKTDVTNSWKANNQNVSVIYYSTMLDIDDKENILLPAMTTRVDITIAKKENVLALPLIALKSKEGKTYVIKVEKDGTKVETPVTLGIYSDEYVEIKEGLAEGDTISTSYNIEQEAEKEKRGKRLLR